MQEKNSAMNSPTLGLVLLVFACFFLSGLTGLIYEVLWIRMITKVIGAAPFAVSTVLTIFMGGLGLGSYLASRTIDRVKEPVKLVRLYGMLELGIALYALAIPAILKGFLPLYATVYNRMFSHFLLYNMLTFIGCFLILCVPVIFMGATLPVLCKFCIRSLKHLGAYAGRLYGLNTIGAALGALLSGFWLINHLGVFGTLWSAVLVNAAIGGACIAASYFVKAPTEHTQEHSSQESVANKQESFFTTATANASLVIFAVSGFCAMAYEVIWTNLLGLIAGPTTYSFTVILVTFITGLALGSMIFGRLADKVQNPMITLLRTQTAAALFVLLASQLLGNSQFFFAKLIYHFKDNFALLSLSKATILFAFMILPTLCLGATFPLVGKIYTRSVAHIGKSIGFAYVINTIGAVSGSFCAGFIFLPLLGKQTSVSITVGLQLLTIAVIIVALRDKKKASIFTLPRAAGAPLLGVLLCFMLPSWNHQLLATGRYHRFDEIEPEIRCTGWLRALLGGQQILSQSLEGAIVYSSDGIAGFTAVEEYTDVLGSVNYVMLISGKPDASSRKDMPTQTLSAHWPMLFHPNARAVMVLGLASGITAGEILHYPVDRVDVVDINRRVVAASDFFIPWNNNVLSDPRTNLIVQDGKAHLQLTEQTYDVIISEPSNPWMAGLAALFTQDFFEIARSRLNPDGIFVQFMHSYQMDWGTFALVGRTFASVFPNNMLVTTKPSGKGPDYLLVGFQDSGGFRLESAAQNLPYAQNSKNVDIRDARLLYRLVVSEDIQRLFGEGVVNTDGRPRLEFAAPRLMYHSGETIEENLRTRKWLGPETTKIAQDVTANVDSQIDFASFALSLHQPCENMVDLSAATAEQKERFFKLMDDYCSNNFMPYFITLEDEELRHRCRLSQIEAARNAISRAPGKAMAFAYLADLLREEGQLSEAMVNYQNSLQIDAENAEVLAKVGSLFAQQGNLNLALQHFAKSLSINPYSPQTNNGLGYIWTQIGNFPKAVEYFRETVKLDPDFTDAYYGLANCLVSLGDRGQAILPLREILRIEPDWPEPMSMLAGILVSDEGAAYYDPPQAVRLAERACELTEYDDPYLLRNLASVYAASGRFTDAVLTAQKALALARSLDQKELAQQIEQHLSLYKSGKRGIEPPR